MVLEGNLRFPKDGVAFSIEGQMLELERHSYISA